MSHYQVSAIGHVRGGRSKLTDDYWAAVTARIDLDPAVVQPTATRGLSEFSHIDVVYVFDQVLAESVCTGARHHRGRTDWPEVGILAQRAKDRPNRIGVTTCQLVGVEELVVEVRGLDALDGTPVLDIKPYMTGFAPRQPVLEPYWATDLMREYW